MAAIAAAPSGPPGDWTPEELAILRDLSIAGLGPIPSDPSNAFADDPRAVALGQKLFFDKRFSANGEVSCASCHKPELGFQDGLPLAKGVGTANRRSMTIVGTAYNAWYFWDGRKDSQWSQALGPLENPMEHGATRGLCAQSLARHYDAEYRQVFGAMPDLSDPARFPVKAGPVPDPEARTAWEKMAPEDRDTVCRVFANMGKALAAYTRRIVPGPSRFDRYLEALEAGDTKAAAAAFRPGEIAGLRLFIGKGDCVRCHNGPLLGDLDFHNTGVPAAAGLPPDDGRASGVRQVLADEFNCLGPYSDAAGADCADLRYAKTGGQALVGSFKTPSLRNAAEREPYMHAGQFATLSAVLAHYSSAPRAQAGQSELKPLGLSAKELAQLEAFIGTLTGPLDVPEGLLRDPHAAPDKADRP
jgi:cytochrome c peroxidase